MSLSVTGDDERTPRHGSPARLHSVYVLRPGQLSHAQLRRVTRALQHPRRSRNPGLDALTKERPRSFTSCLSPSDGQASGNGLPCPWTGPCPPVGSRLAPPRCVLLSVSAKTEESSAVIDLGAVQIGRHVENRRPSGRREPW